MSPDSELPEVRSLDWLEEQIDDRDDSLTRYADKHRRYAFLITILTVTLSALPTASIAIAKILASNPRAENTFLVLASLSGAFTVVVNA